MGAPNGSLRAAPSVDYDKIREEARSAFASKVVEVKGYVAKLRKAQAAAEATLDMSPPRALRGPPPGKLLCFRQQVTQIQNPLHFVSPLYHPINRRFDLDLNSEKMADAETCHALM